MNDRVMPSTTRARLTLADLARARRMREQGYELSVIARRFGTSRKWIGRELQDVAVGSTVAERGGR